jgi:hypothetical protein
MLYFKSGPTVKLACAPFLFKIVFFFKTNRYITKCLFRGTKDIYDGKLFSQLVQNERRLVCHIDKHVGHAFVEVFKALLLIRFLFKHLIVLIY